MRWVTPTDGWVLFAALGLLGAVYYRFWFATVPSALSAHIRSPDYSQWVLLTPDRTLNLRGPLGETQLQIQHHRIRFLHSPCTNQYCVHHGWLQYAGEFFACLPNQISIQIGGQRDFDAIVF